MTRRFPIHAGAARGASRHAGATLWVTPTIRDGAATRRRAATPAPFPIALPMTRFLLPALALALAACQPPADAPDPAAEAAAAEAEAVPVEVLVADPDFFEDALELTGTVDAPNDALLSPDVPGSLTYVAALGSSVRRGQTVAQVKASAQRAGVSQASAGVATARAGIAQAQAGIEQARAGVAAAQAQRRAAQAGLDLAEDQYRRQLPLFRDSILSALEFRAVESQRAQAQAQVAQADAGIAQAQGQLRAAREQLNAARAQVGAAEAGVTSARAQLGNTRIVAPFSGIVEARLAEPGELASPGQPVVRLVSSGAVTVKAGVPERYASDIEPGSAVRVLASAYGAEPRGGRVTFVGSAVDPQSRTFPIEIALDNADRALKPQMVVRLELARDVLQDAIAIPLDAVVRDERGESVFVVTDGEGGAVATRRPVETGPIAGASVVVTDGLRAGDRVIVSGQSTVAEGDRVRIVEPDAPPARTTSAD